MYVDEDAKMTPSAPMEYPALDNELSGSDTVGNQEEEINPGP